MLDIILIIFKSLWFPVVMGIVYYMNMQTLKTWKKLYQDEKQAHDKTKKDYQSFRRQMLEAVNTDEEYVSPRRPSRPVPVAFGSLTLGDRVVSANIDANEIGPEEIRQESVTIDGARTGLILARREENYGTEPALQAEVVTRANYANANFSIRRLLPPQSGYVVRDDDNGLTLSVTETRENAEEVLNNLRNGMMGIVENMRREETDNQRVDIDARFTLRPDPEGNGYQVYDDLIDVELSVTGSLEMLSNYLRRYVELSGDGETYPSGYSIDYDQYGEEWDVNLDGEYIESFVTDTEAMEYINEHYKPPAPLPVVHINKPKRKIEMD